MKKIIHISLTNSVTPNGTYNENMLSKYQSKLGYKVTLICSKWQQNGKGGHCLHPQTDYINSDGIHVLRLGMLGRENLYKKFKLFSKLDFYLEKINPDILFIHGCQFLNIFTIVSYLKKHKNVKVYVDNHADFSNSATNWFSKNILHKIVWRICAKAIEPYTTKFYGVLPARVDFLRNIYNLPKEKCELLLMGADDEIVKQTNKPEVRAQIRKKNNVTNDDFLIVTGGKIDKAKRQTLLLMQAIKQIQNSKLKLIVFGSVDNELQSQFLELVDGEKIQYIGWINSQDSYSYFSAADLVCFPGRHSVFWEQVVGQGIPLVVKDWQGTHHIDVGGNVVFIKQDTVGEIQKNLEQIIFNRDIYNKMKAIAQEKGLRLFSYKEISRRSIEE